MDLLRFWWASSDFGASAWVLMDFPGFSSFASLALDLLGCARPFWDFLALRFLISRESRCMSRFLLGFVSFPRVPSALFFPWAAVRSLLFSLLFVF